jgi:hypothetical protein
MSCLDERPPIKGYFSALRWSWVAKAMRAILVGQRHGDELEGLLLDQLPGPHARPIRARYQNIASVT